LLRRILIYEVRSIAVCTQAVNNETYLVSASFWKVDQQAVHLCAEDWAIHFNAEESMISAIGPGTSTDG